MAKRFKALSIESLVIARMDLTDASPPPHLNLVSGSLPLVIMFPAGQKMAPWTYYSGLSFFSFPSFYSVLTSVNLYPVTVFDLIGNLF